MEAFEEPRTYPLITKQSFHIFSGGSGILHSNTHWKDIKRTYIRNTYAYVPTCY